MISSIFSEDRHRYEHNRDSFEKQNARDQFLGMLHLSKRIEEHKPGIKLCLDELDHATRELLEEILVDEEEHVDWIESQLHIIKEAGFDKLSRPTDPRKVKENPGTPRR